MSFRSVAWIVLALAAFSAEVVAAQSAYMSEGEAQARLKKKVDPTYPPSARAANVHGTVVLKVEISQAGTVRDVNLVSGHPLLAPAAIEAVKQWRYEPYLLNGRPIAVETTVQVRFEPDGEAAPGGEGGVVGSLPGGAPADQMGAIGGILSTSPLRSPRVAMPMRVRISQGVMQAFLLNKVTPTYPPDAIRQHIEGQVTLHVIIDKSGNVANVDPVSGHPLLIPAAVEAVDQWKYKPYLLHQKPVEVETLVLINFILSNGTTYTVIALEELPPSPNGLALPN